MLLRRTLTRGFTDAQVERLAEALWAYEGDPAVDWKGVTDPQFGRARQDWAARLRAKAETLLRAVFPVGEPEHDDPVEALANARGFTDDQIQAAVHVLPLPLFTCADEDHMGKRLHVDRWALVAAVLLAADAVPVGESDDERRWKLKRAFGVRGITVGTEVMGPMLEPGESVEVAAVRAAGTSGGAWAPDGDLVQHAEGEQ